MYIDTQKQSSIRPVGRLDGQHVNMRVQGESETYQLKTTSKPKAHGTEPKLAGLWPSKLGPPGR